MRCLTLGWSQGMLAVCNFFLLICGFSLVAGGMLALYDSDRILLSKLLSQDGFFSSLPQPFFYYAALSLSTLGLTLAATGVLGCWASCMRSYTLLTVYFLIITAALLGECVVYAVAWIWPSCLGLISNPEVLITTLQKNYGVSGNEQFTAAVDLAQTTFGCCGINSANEYDTSLWRLQALGRPLAVPLTCCKLTNENLAKAYLDPRPVNTSLCQTLEFTKHEGFRHLSGCSEPLEKWYGQHFLIFLAIGLIAVMVEFFVLLSTILTCTRLYKFKHRKKKNTTTTANMHTDGFNGHVSNRRPINAYTNDCYDLDMDSFRHNYKLSDKT